MKIITTEQLKAANANAVQKDYNRSGTDEFMDMLDLKGRHIITVMSGFHNDEPHHRCLALCKVNNSPEPVRLSIDVEVEMYEKWLDA